MPFYNKLDDIFVLEKTGVINGEVAINIRQEVMCTVFQKHINDFFCSVDACPVNS